MKGFLSAFFCLLCACGTLRAQAGFQVLDYSPAPGQFIDYSLFLNPGQAYTDLGQEQVRHKLDSLYRESAFTRIVSLGGFGGNITLKLEQAIANRQGNDFKVLGNAFYDPLYTPQLSDTPGGNAEPGIIWVSHDVNQNGVADDPWYEIAGSEQNNPQTSAGYSLTYYFNSENPSGDIAYRSNSGDTGHIFRNEFHTQPSYFPVWLSKDSLTFTGRRLPDNVALIEKAGRQQWLMCSFAFGYADNHPNNSVYSEIDIDWAVDEAGNPVHLESIDFIRVVTAVNRHVSTSVGEISTEFAGIMALHEDTPNENPTEIPDKEASFRVFPNPCRNEIHIALPLPHEASVIELVSLNGNCLRRVPVLSEEKTVRMETGNLNPGIYLVRFAGKTIKLIKLSL